MPPVVAAAQLAARVAAFTWLAVRRPATVPPGDELGPVDQDPDTVREEACKLVSPDRAVCSPPPDSPPPTNNSGGSGGGGGASIDGLSLLFWVLLVAAVLAVLYLLVRHVEWGRRDTSGETDEPADGDVVEHRAVAVDRSREPVDWRAEADEHRRAGRFRDALRCHYRALVGDLARRGVIDEIPGRTTGEERVQLRDVTPAASERFDEAADLFDDAWYGQLDVDDDDVARFCALERDVLGATAGRR